jgi:hypothetical protein
MQEKNLSMAWIYYHKAFDNVPHSWIIKSLVLIGINNKVILFTKKIMGYWRMRMHLHAENKLTEREDKNTMWNISRGLTITVAVCICLIPFTEQLNRLNTGYEERTRKTKISHFMWMV